MDAKSKPRRRHSAQFKAEVIAACAEPGASVAGVARRFELNDNLVHQWRRGRGASAGAETASAVAHRSAEFVALSLLAPTPSLPATASTAGPDIRIELKRGGTAVSVSWPTAAASECGAWLREFLR